MKTLLLIALQLAASGSDAYLTHRGFEMPKHQEHNPIAAPFVGSTRGQIFFFGAGAAARIGGSSFLRHKGKSKLADLVAIEGIGENTGSAIFTGTHLHSIK